VTFHSLRRSYATLQRFLEDADYVADQLGHTDSRFTDRVYRQTTRNRRDGLAPAHRREFDREQAEEDFRKAMSRGI
jgi:integrase